MPAVAAEELLLPYALCTPSDVQIAMQGHSAPGVAPQQITRIVNAFTVKVQGGKFMDRLLEKRSYVEYFNIADRYGIYQPAGASSRRVIVAAPPFQLDEHGEPIVQVWASSSRVYDETTQLTPYVDYDVDVVSGVITARAGIFPAGPRALKVAYPGGLVEPGNRVGDPPIDPIAPPDLKDACVQQMVVLFSRRHFLGVDSMALPGGGSVVLPDPTRWLKGVRDTIHAYKIYRNLN